MVERLQRKSHFNNLKLERKVKIMSDDFKQEQDNELEESEETANGAVEWFKENLRIVVSVLVVLLIAGGIYSYSKRSDSIIEVAEEPTEESAIESMLDELSEKDNIDAEETITAEAVSDETTENETIEDKKAEVKVADTETKNEATISTSTAAQETENSFIEKAEAGDGITHLARKALAHHLEKNADSSLTAEHKVYIEDYLQKKVGSQNGLAIGQTVEFSKSLINEAIASAKNLNDSQLQNLQQYSGNVQF